MDEPASQFERRADEELHEPFDWRFWGCVVTVLAGGALYFGAGIVAGLVLFCVGTIGFLVLAGSRGTFWDAFIELFK